MTIPFMPIHRQFPTNDPHNLEKQLVNFHTQTNTAVNNRTISTYQTDAIANGERWFPSSGSTTLRDGNRKAFSIGSIAAGATLTTAHGISSINSVTRLYGVAQTATPSWLPMPYASVTPNANIEIFADNTNITINNGAASSNITSGIVVIEWI